MGIHFIILDLLMDACILAVVQLALDRLCLSRLARALLMVLGFTALQLLTKVPAGLMQCALCIFSARVLLGRRRLPVILEAAAAIFCAYAAAAGFLLITGMEYLPAAAAMLAFCILLHRRRHIRCLWNIEIQLEHNGAQACFPALIDTGNRLRHHLSGLPVLIIAEHALGDVVRSIDPSECINLSYGVLGGSGELHCFRPDRLRLRVGGRFMDAPECLAAPSPGGMPGGICALAPPEFARAAHPGFRWNTTAFFHKSDRRIQHGVFKHPAVHLWSRCADSSGLGLLHRRQ